MADRFNPFEDRLSRDIRNDLSAALPEVLNRRSTEPAVVAAAPYLTPEPAVHYRLYIDQRLAAYERAIAETPVPPPTEIMITAAMLWDLGLYFEVHEVLEPHWMRAVDERKRLLQALIRAAGVYVYREAGYPQRAAKIAAKAQPVLQHLRTMVPAAIDIDSLIRALGPPVTAPPILIR